MFSIDTVLAIGYSSSVNNKALTTMSYYCNYKISTDLTPTAFLNLLHDVMDTLEEDDDILDDFTIHKNQPSKDHPAHTTVATINGKQWGRLVDELADLTASNSGHLIIVDIQGEDGIDVSRTYAIDGKSYNEDFLPPPFKSSKLK